MNKIIKIGICVIVLPGLVQAKLYLIDQIDAVVCGPEYNAVFTNTDRTWKRGLDNKFIPLKSQIQTNIITQQIVAEKMPLEPDAVNKYVESIKKQNNFNDADLETWFSDIGRTLPEGLALLADSYNSEFFMHFKFKSKLVPTDDEIQAYYDEHPVFIDGYYEVRAALVEKKDDPEKARALVDEIIQHPDKEYPDVSWTAPIRIADEDVSDERAFIKDLKIGQVYMLDLDHGYELYQLAGRTPTTLQPLSERKTAIVDILNRQKLEKMLADYNKSVREYIDIITFGKESQQEVE
ncbi:hypothetical protein KBD08_02565 [Candidatus Babeliales bacterium]|nr:hypothetical protein [Candidatus Babeliales bacterium]